MPHKMYFRGGLPTMGDNPVTLIPCDKEGIECIGEQQQLLLVQSLGSDGDSGGTQVGGKLGEENIRGQYNDGLYVLHVLK